MIKKRLLDALTGKCEHKRENRGQRVFFICNGCGQETGEKVACKKCDIAIDSKTSKTAVVCLYCGTDLPDPTTYFRNYIRLRKHIRLRVGTPRDRAGNALSEVPTFNVGLRFVIPGSPQAVKRVWITFTDKKSQKNFAEQLDRRMRLCRDDEGYNEVINEALDIVRDANPEITEQVVENVEADDN